MPNHRIENIPNYREKRIAAFWRNVDSTSTENGCWPWLGRVTAKGYGCFSNERKLVRAHRFAYEASVGPIPPGLHMLHKCDNPPCCNPNHLFPGTPLDNTADMIAKGRDKRGITPRGEKCWNAKYSDVQIAGVLEMLAIGHFQTAIAKATGMSQSHVSRIANGFRNDTQS